MRLRIHNRRDADRKKLHRQCATGGQRLAVLPVEPRQGQGMAKLVPMTVTRPMEQGHSNTVHSPNCRSSHAPGCRESPETTSPRGSGSTEQKRKTAMKAKATAFDMKALDDARDFFGASQGLADGTCRHPGGTHVRETP